MSRWKIDICVLIFTEEFVEVGMGFSEAVVTWVLISSIVAVGRRIESTWVFA